MIRAILDNRIQLTFIWGLSLCWAIAFPGNSVAAVLRGIKISSSPLTLTLDINHKVPAKVIQIEGKEVLIALKNVKPSKNFNIYGKKASGIKDIRFQALDGGVLAIVVSGTSQFTVTDHFFDKSGKNLSVKFASSTPSKPIPPIVPKSSDKQSKKDIDVPVPKKEEKTVAPIILGDMEEIKQPAATVKQKDTPSSPPERVAVLANQVKKMTAPMYNPNPQPVGEFQGTLEDMCTLISKEACMEPILQESLLLLKKHAYEKASNILDNYLLNENARCSEAARFMRALGHYRGKEFLDDNTKIETINLFKEAVIRAPSGSLLKPFGFAGMGMLHLDLENPYAALGYLNMTRKEYPDYPGMPEVTYHLARIYESQGFLDKALRYYKEVFQAPFRNDYVDKAGFGYAKVLFKKQQFFDSLSIFNYLAKINPKQAYEFPEFLLYMGNANFELAYSKPARDSYVRGINLFPDISEKDILLSKIGDTYAMEDNKDKAIKFYDLVRANYPDGSGYITASMGMARYLPSDAERIEIYEMIKSRFPKNTYARIAMMRLAEMYQQNGEYNKCIKEIEDLLSTHPKGLRYEAVKLMQKAYEALFESQLKDGNYTGVLKRYEQEQIKIDKMDSKALSLSVGLAYLEAKLYEQAFNHLINSYKQYKRRQRSPELLFGLGIAMDETQRDEDALKLFGGFVKQFPKSSNRVAALVRMAKIYEKEGKFKLATARLKKAFSASDNEIEKGQILFLQSQVYEKNNNFSTAARLRNLGIQHIAVAPGTNYPLLASAYKDLGAVQTKAKAYVHAAEAYAKALDFSQEEDGKANIGFLLGDAYQKGNIVGKAKKAFEKVAQNYDSVWARLAKQRLETLALAQALTNS